MRLAYLTSQFPFSSIGENFFAPEVRGLVSLCEQIHLIPARPQVQRGPFGDLGATEVRMGTLAPSTLLQALLEAAQHPIPAVRAFWKLTSPRYAAKAKIKNIAVFPKGLAVARYVRRHSIDHIHAHWLTTSGTIAYVASCLTGVSWSCTAHAHDIFSDNLLALKAASARFVRVISERNRKAVDRFTGHQFAGKIFVGHLGVDVPTRVAPRSQSQSARMLCPARLHPKKGHSDLLNALAILHERGVAFHCDLAGDGDSRSAIEQQIDQLQLRQYVTLRGLVSYDSLLRDFQNGEYDIVVLASLEEGIPVALMEAMAAGIPCVSTRIGSVPELITDTTGMLVEPHAAHAFADALEALAVNPEFRLRLGAAARERITTHFNACRTTRQLYERMQDSVGDWGGHAIPRPVRKPQTIPVANAD
jgi:glycosyltransferase involved in cell wall biosynthesis